MVSANPGREASSTSRGQRVTVFSWVDFFLSIFQDTKSKNSQNLVRCFRCWPGQCLDLILTKQI